MSIVVVFENRIRCEATQTFFLIATHLEVSSSYKIFNNTHAALPPPRKLLQCRSENSSLSLRYSCGVIFNWTSFPLALLSAKVASLSSSSLFSSELRCSTYFTAQTEEGGKLWHSTNGEKFSFLPNGVKSYNFIRKGGV